MSTSIRVLTSDLGPVDQKKLLQKKDRSIAREDVPDEYEEAVFDNEDFIIWGPASVEQRDNQGQEIKMDAIADDLDRWMRNDGHISMKHKDVIVGDALWEWSRDDGKKFETKVTDENFYLCANLRNDTEKAKEMRLRSLMGEFDGYSVTIFSTEEARRTDDNARVTTECDLHAVTLGTGDMVVNPDAQYDVVDTKMFDLKGMVLGRLDQKANKYDTKEAIMDAASSRPVMGSIKGRDTATAFAFLKQKGNHQGIPEREVKRIVQELSQRNLSPKVWGDVATNKLGLSSNEANRMKNYLIGARDSPWKKGSRPDDAPDPDATAESDTSANEQSTNTSTSSSPSSASDDRMDELSMSNFIKKQEALQEAIDQKVKISGGGLAANQNAKTEAFLKMLQMLDEAGARANLESIAQKVKSGKMSQKEGIEELKRLGFDQLAKDAEKQLQLQGEVRPEDLRTTISSQFGRVGEDADMTPDFNAMVNEKLDARRSTNADDASVDNKLAEALKERL